MNRDGIQDIVINRELGGRLDYFAGEISDVATACYSLFVAHDGSERLVTWNEVLEISERLRYWLHEIQATVFYQRQSELAELRAQRARDNLSAFNIYRLAMERRHKALATMDRPIIWFTREPTEQEAEWLRLFARSR